VRVPIVRIGNSRGFRLPKAVPDQCLIADQVELTVKNGTVRPTPVRSARRGWEEAFAAMAAAGDDAALVPEEIGHDWDQHEWGW